MRNVTKSRRRSHLALEDHAPGVHLGVHSAPAKMNFGGTVLSPLRATNSAWGPANGEPRNEPRTRRPQQLTTNSEREEQRNENDNKPTNDIQRKADIDPNLLDSGGLGARRGRPRRHGLQPAALPLNFQSPSIVKRALLGNHESRQPATVPSGCRRASIKVVTVPWHRIVYSR